MKIQLIPRSTLLVAAGLLVLSCATAPETPPGITGTAPAAPTGPTNLAYGKYAKSNNHIYEFTADKAVDGEVLSYWEGGANAYPNDLSVDLGKPTKVSKLVLKLNPKRIWQPRTQTIEVLGSDDGESFRSLVPAKAYDFDPIDSDNSVEIAVDAKVNQVMLRFTTNTEATAGQLAELEVY